MIDPVYKLVSAFQHLIFQMLLRSSIGFPFNSSISSSASIIIWFEWRATAKSRSKADSWRTLESFQAYRSISYWCIWVSDFFFREFARILYIIDLLFS